MARWAGDRTLRERLLQRLEPAKNAFPIIEDALARYSRQRRKGFK